MKLKITDRYVTRPGIRKIKELLLQEYHYKKASRPPPKVVSLVLPKFPFLSRIVLSFTPYQDAAHQATARPDELTPHPLVTDQSNVGVYILRFSFPIQKDGTGTVLRS